MKNWFTQDIINDAFPTYINFICNALTGLNPDDFYRENEGSILLIAEFLQMKMRVKQTLAHRGILLDPKEQESRKLKPLDNVTFLSFSEDKRIAECFADMEHPMSMFVKKATPHFEGYLIEHKVEPENILFHYKWARPLGITHVLDMDILNLQQEILTIQMAHHFELTPYVRGASLRHGYKTGMG